MTTAVTDADQRLWKVADVAARLGIGKSKTWELIARDEIKSVKIDGSRRVSEQAIRAYIRQLEGGTPDAA